MAAYLALQAHFCPSTQYAGHTCTTREATCMSAMQGGALAPIRNRLTQVVCSKSPSLAATITGALEVNILV